MNSIYSINVRNIFNLIRTSDKSFSLILMYIIVEYVRPQTLYPQIDIIPYGKVIIILCIFTVVFDKNKYPVTSSVNTLMFLFLSTIVISSIFGLSFHTSKEAWADFFDWLVIYHLIIRIVNTEKKFFIFTFVFLLCSFKMAQYSLRGWITGGMGYSSYGFGAGAGFFHNSGEFGIQMCIYFPIAYYFCTSLRRHWSKLQATLLLILPITGFTGMFSSSNRGTIVGGAAVFCWIALKSRHKFKALICIAIVATISLQLIPPEQRTRFEQAGDDNTSVARLDNWKKGLKMAEMSPVFGMGYKTWAIADATYFNGVGLMPHNIFIECLSELGYSGLLLFLIMIWATFVNNRKTRKLITETNGSLFIYSMANALDAALIGYLVTGFFITVLYYPYFWINLAMTVSLNNIVKSECLRNQNEVTGDQKTNSKAVPELV